MKKFLKTLLIILVIGGAIGATCFFFFKNLQREKDSFAAVNAFVYGVEEEEFNAKIDRAQNYVEDYDAGDIRFGTLQETGANLISMAKVLDYYLLNVKAHNVDQNKIVNCVNDVISARNGCQSAFNEFFIKCEGASEEFNVSLAANNLFVKLANYLNKYATFVDVLNGEVCSNIVAKKLDVKFSYFEVYSKCIALQTTEVQTLSQITNFKNIQFINTLNAGCNVQNGQVVVKGDSYNGNINKFIEHYLRCDAELFAKDLKDNLLTCTSLDGLTTDEAKATYYFITLFVV